MNEDNVTGSDIVIPVMGPTGAGKSTFINALLNEERMPIGHSLTSCTNDVFASRLAFDAVYETFSVFKNHRLIIVDTPGFDDTYEGDLNILHKIGKWLDNSYRQRAILGGVIYLHDISSDRFSGTARRNLETFNHMCGDSALCKVVIGTTKWSRVVNGTERELEMKELHWKSMIAKGSQTCQFHDDYSSAWSFIDIILRRFALDNVLEIQKELAIDKKTIPETKAGRELRYTLQQALEMQKRILDFRGHGSQENDQDVFKEQLDEARQKMEKIAKQIQELKIPAPRRIRLLLGL